MYNIVKVKLNKFNYVSKIKYWLHKKSVGENKIESIIVNT